MTFKFKKEERYVDFKTQEVEVLWYLVRVVNANRDVLNQAKSAAVRELLDRLEAWENVFGHLGTPDEVGNEWHSLSDRLEAAEAEALEQARLNGMGSEREAALLSKLEAAEKERDALRDVLMAINNAAPEAKP